MQPCINGTMVKVELGVLSWGVPKRGHTGNYTKWRVYLLHNINSES